MCRAFGRVGTMTVAIAIAVLLLGCASGDSLKPIFRYDLQPQGLKTKAAGAMTASYNQIAFLNDDLLLVSLNQRTITLPVEPSSVDMPRSKLLLFDFKRQAVIRSIELPVEKDRYSIQPLSRARFAIRNESGIQICDLSFICGQPMTVPQGSLVASPAGTFFTVGGYGQKGQVLIDSESLSELDRFSWNNPQVIPGDGLILLRYSNATQLFVKEAGNVQRALPFSDNGGIVLPDSRFLGKEAIAVNETTEALLVARPDGTSLYHIPVHSWSRGTAIVSSASGRCFGIHESDYTRWNSITNFLDIDSGRPYNFERIRVFEVASGKTLLQLEHDPRPYVKQLTLPALSPDGHHLAMINRGFVEVYEIP
jgi:hypothetical protein